MVYANQQAYYDAITANSRIGESGPFIDFMLNEIYATLKKHQGEPIANTTNETFGNTIAADRGFDEKFGKEFGVNEKTVLLLLNDNPTISANEIAERTGLSKRGIEKQIKKFRDLGILSRSGSDKNGLWIVNAE